MNIITFITFVGGPRHGERQYLVDPEPLLWLSTNEGRVVAYGVRHSESGQAFYAPVGMSHDAYLELVSSLVALPANL